VSCARWTRPFERSLLQRRFKVSTYQLDKVMDMTRLLLTLLVSFVPQLYGAEMASKQRVLAATL